MKKYLNVLLVMLIAAALMQLCCVYVELKSNCDTLTRQVQNDGEQLCVYMAAAYARTHQDAQKIAELEAKLKALTAEEVESTGLQPASATHLADAKTMKSPWRPQDPARETGGKQGSVSRAGSPGVFNAESSSFANKPVNPITDNL